MATTPTDSAPSPPGTRPPGPDSWADEATAPLFAARAFDPRLDADVGAVVGRYTLVESLGMGGTGIVFAAHDEQLGRRVAIKLLRSDRGRGSGSRARMLGEAQAMAQLNHPNVIRVYDVGVVDDRAFIAMELIEGCTLAEWLAKPRPWREILDVFTAAGRGLAAAHGAGLVHRDFKPHNVLIARDGSVRVLDFGLATGIGAVTGAPRSGANAGPIDLDEDETRDVLVIGTPGYMSPEQHLELPLDARSDQFGFCVALYGALYRQRPFVGETLEALLQAILAGPPSAPPPRTGVPAPVFAVLRRGLAAAPAERWPDMDALLEALGRARMRSRRVALFAAVGVASIATVGFAFAVSPAAALSRCARAEVPELLPWNAAARDRVRTSLLATQAAHAEATFTRVDTQIDGYMQRWIAGRRAACADAEAEHDDRSVDARLDCLDDRLAAVNTLVQALGSADIALVDRAVESAAGLPNIEACADPDALARAAPQPDDPSQRQEAAEIRHILAGADTLANAGRLDEAMTSVDLALARARALGHPATLAEAAYASGSTLRERGEVAQAEALLEEAATSASAIGHDRLLARAATELATVLARGGEFEAAERWLRYADAAAGRDPDDRGAAALVHHCRGFLLYERARYSDAAVEYEAALAIQQELGNELGAANTLINLGSTRLQQGDYSGAAETFRRVLPIMTSALGDEHPRVALALANLAITHDGLGQYERSIEFGRRALAMRERVLGPKHPDTGASHINLGLSLNNAGRLAEAKEHLERAIEIHGASLGEDHVLVAASLNNLALVEAGLGDVERALALHRRALEIRRKRLEPQHPEIATSLANVGIGLMELGRLAEARVHLEEALAIDEHALGAMHPEVALVHVDLARLAEREGDHLAAEREFAAAIAVEETALGPTHPNLVRALLGLGRAHAALGRHADAIVPLERALAIATASEVSAELRAEARFALAKALHDGKGDRKRARELATEARASHGAGPDAKAVAEIDAWLDRTGD